MYIPDWYTTCAHAKRHAAGDMSTLMRMCQSSELGCITRCMQALEHCRTELGVVWQVRMKETEKVMKQVDKEERRRSKLQGSKPGVSWTPPMVVRLVTFSTPLHTNDLVTNCQGAQVADCQDTEETGRSLGLSFLYVVQQSDYFTIAAIDRSKSGGCAMCRYHTRGAVVCIVSSCLSQVSNITFGP